MVMTLIREQLPERIRGTNQMYQNHKTGKKMSNEIYFTNRGIDFRNRCGFKI